MTMQESLANQTVLVVGASSGIGLSTARRAALAGAHVVMASRSRAKLEDAAQGLEAERSRAGVRTGSLRAWTIDMLDRAAVGERLHPLESVDHVVLTAVADELASRAPVTELTTEQIERTFDKLRGFVNVIRVVVPRLRERGSITLVTGVSAVRPPRDGFSVLAAASGSITSLGKALALELAPRRVNVIMAGVVDTPIHAGHRHETKTWAERALPAQRFGEPDDLAHAIEFAMTNPYLTASTLTVDGGFVQI